MFSFLEKIRTGLTLSPVETAIEQKEIDYEADGFLLVGETEAEKANAYSGIKSVCNIRPSYSQSATSVKYNKMLKSNVENTNTDCFVEHHTPSNISPLSDIPFKLSPNLEILTKYLDFEIHNIPHENNSLQNYNYDFNFEISLLRDLEQDGNNISPARSNNFLKSCPEYLF